MSRKSKTPDYQEKARILKNAGLLNIDLRKKLTPAMKGRITRLTEYKKGTTLEEKLNPENLPPLRAFVKYPDLFTTVKLDKKQAAIFKQSGYEIINGRAVIRNQTGAKTRVLPSKGIIVYESKVATETIYLASHKDFFKKAEKIFNTKLAKGEFITGRFGNLGVFASKFVSYKDFYRYVSEKFGWDNPEIQQLQLAVVNIKKPTKKK